MLLLAGHGTAALAQIALLSGTDLDGWVTSRNANRHASEGGVEANSGIFIRCADSGAISPNSCYEVNIFDRREGLTYRTGAITDFAAPAAQINRGGQWNTYEIRAESTRLLVTLNGTVTADLEDSTHSEGPLTLQYFAGAVKFRNVQLTPLFDIG